MKKPRKVFTCVFVLEDDKILLGYKKRGLLEGKWNGFGGKVEPGETILQAAYRELEEECGLKSNDSFSNGLLTVELEGGSYISDVHLFTTRKFNGTIVESNEMIPEWFEIGNIPYKGMCYDAGIWLPLLLEGKKFDAYFLYDKNGSVLKENITIQE